MRAYIWAWMTVALGMIGVVLLVVGLARLVSADRSAIGHLPIWLLLVDIGIICDAIALVTLATSPVRPTLVLTHQVSAAPVSTVDPPKVVPSPVVETPTGPSPNMPWPANSTDTAPPATRSPAVESAPALDKPLGFLATLSSEYIAQPPPASEDDLPGEPSPENPAVAPIIVPATSSSQVEPGPTPLECVRCGIALSLRSGWRKCTECGRTLCENCLLVNLREHGRSVCDACAGQTLRRDG